MTDPHDTGLLNGCTCNARLWCKGTPKPLSGFVPGWLPSAWVATRYLPHKLKMPVRVDPGLRSRHTTIHHVCDSLLCELGLICINTPGTEYGK